MSGDIAGHGIAWTSSCCKKCCTIPALCGLALSSMNIGLSANAWLSKWGDYAWSEPIVTVFLAWPRKTTTREDRFISRRVRQRPFSTAGALRGNLALGGHISTRTIISRLDMNRSSLVVVLRGLPARGRSVAFPVWRKHCISRTMMEWLTLKWSATLLWLKPLNTD
jgi:hypothetical protein